MISVISAVKGRIDLTKKSFESIWKKCSDPKNIEHIVSFDCHDRQMAAYLKEYSEYCFSNNFRARISKVCFCGNMDQYKNRNMHRDYWNPLANSARGDIVFGLCNDFVIQTQDYDTIMEKSLESACRKYKHDIFQIIIDDDYFDIREKLNETKYCAPIILSKAALEVFNGIAPIEYSSQGADVFTANVFAGTHINSTIDLIEKIKIKQFSIQRGNYPKDNVQTERPTLDISRPGHEHRMDILFGKKYYHSLINSLIFKKYLTHDKKRHNNG
tara:strand:+ start:267 stop:1079 length:813 start_codon:yes stop_codon:yes gene_type:complete